MGVDTEWLRMAVEQRDMWAEQIDEHVEYLKVRMDEAYALRLEDDGDIARIHYEEALRIAQGED